MSAIKTYQMSNSAIAKINLIADQIEFYPPYQRNSDIWDLAKRQLFIDSILNDFDIPKIYFHYVIGQHCKLKNGKIAQFAIIDGKQRMETIRQFISDTFPLAEDFVYYNNPIITPRNLKYSQIAKKYPELKVAFDSYTLPIIVVETDDTELIDEMFSRLNEAIALSSAEKRNALGGPIPTFINELANHPFFTSKVSFSNKRYQHKEAAAKLLFLENCLLYHRKIKDTKRAFLDAFVKEYRKRQIQKKLVPVDPSILRNSVFNVLDKLEILFKEKDPLLSQQGIVVIYFLLMRGAIRHQKTSMITKEKLEQFHQSIYDNKMLAERDITKADYNLLAFDRLSMQGSNDANSIKERLRIISDYFGLEKNQNSLNK